VGCWAGWPSSALPRVHISAHGNVVFSKITVNAFN
jgi:hypothetical protein